MKKIKWIGVSLSIILALAITLCGIKLIKHEKSQQDRIASLEAQLNFIQAENNKSIVVWNPNDYNYLAIGNSITIHAPNEYWWNECGMAASTVEKDFVHQIAAELDANMYAYNFYAWEMTGHDRGESLSLLDDLLSDQLDLVTIQLSENVLELSTFQSDFEELIRYIQKNASNAKIIVIGDFWDTEQKDEMKKKACAATGVHFVSLDDIKGLKEYQCGMGAVVYDEQGNSHVVEHDGTALHPSDEGMTWIAEKALEVIKAK